MALALACSSESTLADADADHDEVASAKPTEPSSREPASPRVGDTAPATATAVVAPTEHALDEVLTTGAAEPAAPSAEAAAAPILPSGLVPGSPEADAELAELLDESTLTQEEFDRAFRGGGPQIEGDQFMFGPNERPRGRPLVDVGTPSVSGSSVSSSKLADMARGSQRDLEGCYALALGKDPKLTGAVTLALRFDAHGVASGAKIEGSSPLGAALDRCLVSVADAWTLQAAAGATVRVPLKLSIAAGTL